MKNQQAVNKTADFIKKKFTDDTTGHDWWHMYRVWQLAKHISKEEKGADPLVVELAALLHDIADWKFHSGDFEAGPKAARQWLESLNVDERTIQHIEEIVRNISFKGANIKPNLKTLEGQIVHDADKLDAMGAVGIARTFVFGGAHGRSLYDPDQPHLKEYTFVLSEHNKTSAIHHFYEKLLLLKDRMYTKTGKKMAQHRHAYLESYLEEFYKEWNGEL